MAAKYGKSEPMQSRFTSSKLAFFALFALALQTSLYRSQADTVANQNSVYTFDFTGGGGLTGWAVDGQNQVDNQWFYYRIGSSGGEHPINFLSAPTVTLSSSGSFTNLTVSYSDAALSVSVGYTLGGNNAGSGKSGFSELISVSNTSGASMDLHFFDYSHYNIAEDTGNQTMRIGTAAGKPNAIFQTNNVANYLTETLSSLTPGTREAQIALGGVLLGSLNDGAPTTLVNTFGPLGPADLESAFEFDWTIAAGGTASISTTGPNIVVPEPSALALIISGLGIWGLRRKRQG
jgi:hypothetical protein